MISDVFKSSRKSCDKRETKPQLSSQCSAIQLFYAISYKLPFIFLRFLAVHSISISVPKGSTATPTHVLAWTMLFWLDKYSSNKPRGEMDTHGFETLEERGINFVDFAKILHICDVYIDFDDVVEA